jgi:DNA-binding GntR family transcriptional regulator
VVQSLDDIATMVGDATLTVGSWRPERSAADARLFGLPAATPLPCLRGVLARRGRPYARSIIYFPPDVGGRLALADFDDPVVFRILRRVLGIRLAEVEVTLSATGANTADVAAVGGAAGGPVLLTQLRYRDEAGRLVEVAYSRGIADAPHFTTRLLAAPREERA